MKQGSTGTFDGIEGWTTLSGMSADRINASKFRRENPELAQMYIERTYRRVLRLHPHMSKN
jgi:hypothetical protein